MKAETNTYEQLAAAAFDNQSEVFDQIYGRDKIIAYKRQRVHNHLLQYLQPGSTVLELNCGTGEDAIFLGQLGCKVHATDIAPGMLRRLQQKVDALNLNETVTSETCSFGQLQQLNNEGPYDHIFSNFAGLNCTSDLDKVLGSFSGLLKPGGKVTLVLLPRFCLWESLLVFKGKFRTAFRRFFSTRGREAHVEGIHFRCWYYNPSYVRTCLKENFVHLSTEGLCTLVPPSYILGFADHYPQLFGFLKQAENRLRYLWPWKFVGDYYIISFVKKGG
ncbi:class I SAM-dependent methyltransferase [Flavihumibacter solisilvae]|uniref:Methyltransferase domain-containing protein n=1 Tax=Flavihumibacter solisilvae TaxID=1349421 RepID=A0A0C1L2C4_9BACT|nr:class I SAM-dependent methyltransferase [Flavihumibacter solisilvae]KIC93761.1 hypothetical protein OI18_15440 [Flavihumibacter solisilvae]